MTTLNLERNDIGDEGAKALAENSTLTTLDLFHNGIGAEGAKALAENSTLTTLNLYTNGIGDEGAKALAENSTLTTLDLGGNGIDGDILRLVDDTLDRNRQRLALSAEEEDSQPNAPNGSGLDVGTPAAWVEEDKKVLPVAACCRCSPMCLIF